MCYCLGSSIIACSDFLLVHFHLSIGGNPADYISELAIFIKHISWYIICNFEKITDLLENVPVKDNISMCSVSR